MSCHPSLINASCRCSPPHPHPCLECHHPPLRSVLQGRNYRKAAKTPHKKTTLARKHMGSSDVHSSPGTQTLCVCMYVFCTVGQKYKLKVSAGEGRCQNSGSFFFFGVIKMQHQSLHAATKPDKTHMYT